MAPRLENTLTEDAVADSLVDPEGAVPLSSINFDGVADERMAEEWPNEQADFVESEGEPEEQKSEPRQAQPVQSVLNDEELDELIAQRSQPESQEQSQPQEYREPTPAEVNEGVQRLGQEAERLGLNDQASAQQLAYDLSVPFGAAPGAIDHQALGSTMSKAVLSAVSIYESLNGDITQPLPPIPLASAQAFTGDLLRAFNVDPRTVQVDAQGLASLALGATLNIINTVEEHGIDAGLDRINDPQIAEFFANRLNQLFGINQPADRATALHIADSFAKYVLGGLRKLPRADDEQQPQQQPRRQRAHVETNEELFNDPEILRKIRMERL